MIEAVLERPRSAGRAVTRAVLSHPRVLIALVAIGLSLGGAWLWVRDSWLVAVKQVRITGVSGPDAGRIRIALLAAARNMTILDVQMEALQTAVSPFPVVKSLQVSTQFPHGIRIHVIEQIPVAAVVVGGRSIAVAADGTLLHDVPVTVGLASIPLNVAPGGSRVTDRTVLGAVAVLGAAPYAFLPRVNTVTTIAPHGLVAQISGGPSIYFGDTSRLQAKWTAAVQVLADPGSSGASYIDVSDPDRPAAGALTGGGSSSTSTTASSTVTLTTAATSTPSTSTTSTNPIGP
jgi:cell division protein FtsQ